MPSGGEEVNHVPQWAERINYLANLRADRRDGDLKIVECGLVRRHLEVVVLSWIAGCLGHETTTRIGYERFEGIRHLNNDVDLCGRQFDHFGSLFIAKSV
jgi:hypothetical protein